MAYISMQERQAAAAKGLAFPDFSYPIRNQAELDKAWKLRNNSKMHSEQEVIAHIKKAARKLGLRLPEELRGDTDEEDAPDLTGVSADLGAALGALEGAWGPIQDAWIDVLAAQVEAAAESGDFDSLDVGDTGGAAEVIYAALAGMEETARSRAVRELAEQGIDVDSIDLGGLGS